MRLSQAGFGWLSAACPFSDLAGARARASGCGPHRRRRRRRGTIQRLSADDRLIVSEPFSDLPGVWREIPQETVATVAAGGVLEERPFRPRPPDRA
jgi:hypothetical protein